jgi:hypothetical protein
MNYGNIKKVDQSGIITSLVNNSNYYFKSITSDNSGNIYFIDQYNWPLSIQKVDSLGTISSYITNNLNDPKSLIADNNGNLFFIDYNNGRYKIMTVITPALLASEDREEARNFLLEEIVPYSGIIINEEDLINIFYASKIKSRLSNWFWFLYSKLNFFINRIILNYLFLRYKFLLIYILLEF